MKTVKEVKNDSYGEVKEFTPKEIFEWFQSKSFQREQGQQEYTLIYEIDLPKIINLFIKEKINADKL